MSSVETSHGAKPQTATPSSSHYTKLPLWYMFYGTGVCALIPLLKYKRIVAEIESAPSLPLMMAGGAVIGTVIGAMFVARTHIPSPRWSKLLFWLGVVVLGFVGSALFGIMTSTH